ncbi:addiction module protein [Candidatus Omnitrophota bacterium]
MPKSLADIEKEANELDDRDRALLAEHLLATLDQDTDTDAEELWLQEAEKRYQDYRAGKIGAKSADQVFEEAGNRIK